MRDLTASQLTESGRRGFSWSKGIDQVLEVVQRRIVGRERKTRREVICRVAERRISVRANDPDEVAVAIRDQTGSRISQLILDTLSQGISRGGKCFDDRLPGRNGLNWVTQLRQFGIDFIR